MGIRADLPKIKSDEQPSFFNREAGMWGEVGSILGGLASLVIPNRAVKYGVVATVAGAGVVLGGLQGLSRQKEEAINGRVVKDPSYWNSGILSGSLVAGLITMPFGYFLAKPEALLSGSTTALATVGLATAAWLGGVIAGSVMRKNSMQRDFDKAVELQNQEKARAKELLESVAKGKGHEMDAPVPSYKNSVTPDEAAALAEKQKSADHSHANVQEQRTANHATNQPASLSA